MPSNRESAKSNSKMVVNFLRRGLTLILVALIMFMAGFTIHKYWASRHFPFRQLRHLAWVVGSHPNPKELLSQQYSSDVEKIALDRNIDTELCRSRSMVYASAITFEFPKPPARLPRSATLQSSLTGWGISTPVRRIESILIVFRFPNSQIMPQII